MVDRTELGEPGNVGHRGRAQPGRAVTLGQGHQGRRPWCRNIARTDRDIAQLRTRRHDLTLIVDDSLAPPIRHRRDQYELQRIDIILETHDEGSGPGE